MRTKTTTTPRFLISFAVASMLSACAADADLTHEVVDEGAVGGDRRPTVPASCGDGVVQAANAETCDDGNLQDGDGCSGSCRTEVPTRDCQTMMPVGCGGKVIASPDDSASAGDGYRTVAFSFRAPVAVDVVAEVVGAFGQSYDLFLLQAPTDGCDPADAIATALEDQSLEFSVLSVDLYYLVVGGDVESGAFQLSVACTRVP